MTKNPIMIVLGIANGAMAGADLYWAFESYHNPVAPGIAVVAFIAVSLLNGAVAYMCLFDKFPGR